MTKENKNLFITIALGTIIIGSLASFVVYFTFGARAGYFFMIVLAVPLGAISSLLLMILFRAMKKTP